MRRIDIVTIFPDAMTPYLQQSMMKRGQAQGHVRIDVHDLRAWGEGKHRKVDDSPYGGGAGMVMKVGPFFHALKALRVPHARPQSVTRKRTRVLLTSAKGKLFTERDVERYERKYGRLVILCGHYEGVDERVAQHLADEEVSIGPYVLTGGELPALVITDAVTRLIPGVLGNAESPKDESYARSNIQYATSNIQPSLEYPQYTRPENFSPRAGSHWKVPAVLLGGNHAAIKAWREQHRG